MKNFKFVVISVFVLTACATAVKLTDGRSPQAVSGDAEATANSAYGYPTGLNGEDVADFEHLSEGSDIYPYEWMLALKSVASPDKSGHFTTPFLSNLDQRFGLLRTRNRGKYLMDYAGLSAAWSDHPPQQSDALHSERDIKVREFQGKKTIKMVGTNCALCHNGEVVYKNHAYRIDGAPAMADVRGYFQDLALSTIAVLAKKDLLVEFLKNLNVSSPEERATELNDFFKAELGQETSWIGMRVDAVSENLTLLLAKYFGRRDRLFKGQKAIGVTLEKLLRITYHFSESDDIGELKSRMAFLGTLMVGTNPHVSETNSGFSRTDAFGRIGNLVLRGTNPVPYTAPVSLPWIWGIRNTALLHYTSNTNSVMLRNIGQSLGLGSLILDDSGRSTVNVYNLDRLEHLVHKIKVPDWRAVFASEPDLKIKNELLPRGQEVYEQNCKKCHETTVRVGPRNSLYSYNVLNLERVGTDEQAARNIVVPVGQKSFQEAIFAAVERVKTKYYESNGVSAEQQAAMEFRDLRGPEFFRDTFNGYHDQAKDGNNYGDIEPGGGYTARHLSGVWSTAPFLHNGSVPTLWDLLQPPNNRPRIFNVKSHEFDAKKVGFINERPKTFKFFESCASNDDACFDTRVAGNHNQGHPFGTHLSDDDKWALIEYLKVLPPEPEYSW